MLGIARERHIGAGLETIRLEKYIEETVVRTGTSLVLPVVVVI